MLDEGCKVALEPSERAQKGDWDVTCYVGVRVSRGKDRNIIRKGELGFRTKWEVVSAVLHGKGTVCNEGALVRLPNKVTK
jgi:hypothetical protein